MYAHVSEKKNVSISSRFNSLYLKAFFFYVEEDKINTKCSLLVTSEINWYIKWIRHLRYKQMLPLITLQLTYFFKQAHSQYTL